VGSGQPLESGSSCGWDLVFFIETKIFLFLASQNGAPSCYYCLMAGPVGAGDGQPCCEAVNLEISCWNLASSRGCDLESRCRKAGYPVSSSPE
jgi:hypothetical protein